MTKRIFNAVSVVAISHIIVVLALCTGLSYQYFTNQRIEMLKEETHVVANGVELSGQEFLDCSVQHNSRITWIDRQGNVLFDSHSDITKMENHNLRQEIAQAISTGYGQSMRYSDTLTEQYLYCAQRLEDGTIIRLSLAQSSSLALVGNMMYYIAIILILAVGISLLLAKQLAYSIIEPLNKLNLENPTDNSRYDELAPLLNRIDSQQKEIKHQTYELQRQNDELNTIIDSMTEGIVLVKANGYVISINNTAIKLLEIEGRAVNKLFATLCRNKDILQAMEEALQGNSVERITELSGGVYRVNISPVISENRVVGIALLFFDITEREKSEQMRREFTANVSHELKSPLHAISGYSELIMNGIATGEDAIGFSRRINSEAHRMNSIIQDIITLSQLDERAIGMTRQPVDVYTLAQSVKTSLKDTAANANVTVDITGENAVFTAIMPLINSVVYNLCENAIKYNKPNGFVKINVADSSDNVVITVSDSGIGIPAEHQENIFQRFYRVDKSRSREKGGSGLGLSIVKHAVKIHDGKIELSSAPDKGTTIIIKFPK